MITMIKITSKLGQHDSPISFDGFLNIITIEDQLREILKSGKTRRILEITLKND